VCLPWASAPPGRSIPFAGFLTGSNPQVSTPFASSCFVSERWSPKSFRGLKKKKERANQETITTTTHMQRGKGGVLRRWSLGRGCMLNFNVRFLTHKNPLEHFCPTTPPDRNPLIVIDQSVGTLFPSLRIGTNCMMGWQPVISGTA